MRKLIQISCGAALALMLATSSAQAAYLWASDSDGGAYSTLFKLDPATGAVLSSLPGPGLYADALSFANDGNSIFVLDSSNNSTVYQIDTAGALLNSFFVPLDSEGLTILADGSLYIGGGMSGVIAKVDPSTGTILSQFPVRNEVYGMASNGKDTLYGLQIGGVIDSYDLAGNFLGSLTTGVGGVTLGLAFTGNSFYISTTGSQGVIAEVDWNGQVIRSFGTPGEFTEGLDYPEGVQVTPDAGATSGLLGAGLVALAAGYRRRV